MKSVIIAFILFVTSISAREARYRIEPFALFSTNNTISESSELWEISSTGGVGLRLPVVNVPLNFSFSIELGNVTGADTLPEFVTFLTSILVEYEQLFHPHFRLIAGGGITNMLITADDDWNITKPFAGESENEFGLALTLEPTLVIRKFTLALRSLFREIFSAPHSVALLSLSGIMGWRF